MAIQNRPIVNLSLAINYAIGDLDVLGYHFFNLVVHILATLTLFGIIRRTLRLPVVPESIAAGAAPMALISALIWTVHPLQTEAVTYIIQRTESMMGLFYLLTLYCAIRGAGASSPGRWYLAAVAACTLGTGCKEVMVSAPLIVLIYDRVFLSHSFKEVFRRRWTLYVGLAVTWVLLAALVLPAGGRAGSAHIGYWESLHAYAMSQCIVIVRYLRLCFWPHPLIMDYGLLVTGPAPSVLPYAVIIILLLVATIWALCRRPRFGFLGLWFFAILAPSSSIMPLLVQPSAEKRMYLPLAAAIVAVVVCAHAIGRSLINRLGLSKGPVAIVGRLAAVGLGGTVVVILGFLTVGRNGDYRSRISIWQDTVNKLPQNCRAWNNLGVAHAEQGNYNRAIDNYNIALRLYPEFADAYLNRGHTYRDKGRYKQAISDYSEAIKLNWHLPKVYASRAQAYFFTRQYEEAWSDVKACQGFGGKVQPGFLAALGRASGRR